MLYKTRFVAAVWYKMLYRIGQDPAKVVPNGPESPNRVVQLRTMLYNTPMKLLMPHDQPRPLFTIGAEPPIYDPSDIETDYGRWEGAVIFIDCPHTGIRGRWHRMTGRKAHILGYVNNLTLS